MYIVTKGNWGGAQRYVYDLACEATARGFLPVVASGENGLLTRRLKELGIATKQLPSLARDVSIFKDFRSFFEIFRLVQKIRPAVIHVNSSKAGGIGALAARLASSACIVFTVHGLPQNEDRSWLPKKIIVLLTWLTALLSHRVIAITNGDAEQLRRQPFLRKKIHYIPNGIAYVGKDRDRARALIVSHISDTNAQEKLAGGIWIGTVAELTRNKGHQYALEALVTLSNRYPNIVYVVVGDGELSPEYKLFVEEHDLQNHVFFTGFIPDAAELYSAFDIYLASSIKEGLPYTIIEAMSSGVPIVASRVGGIPDVIMHGISGHLIVIHSSDAIVEALTHILENKAYRAALGENARREALKTYTKSAMAEKTFRLYDNCTHL